MKETHKMMEFLSIMVRQAIDNLRTSTHGRSDIEEYVNSKRPTTATEAEYWMREYDRTQSRQGIF